MASVAPQRQRSTPAAGRARELGRSFVAGPIAIPCLVAVAVMIVWATSQAGQPTSHWYPGGLVILGLLVLAAATLPLRLREVPKPVLIAAGFLLAFTAWSFISITWADAKGDAWDGANRTLLYLVAFVLFGLWRHRAGAATAVVTLWILAISVIAAVVLVRTSGSAGLGLFREGRLRDPAGYANATAALFLMPAWPAVVMAGRSELGWALRALMGGAATLLGGVALMALSRGATFSTPIMVILLFVLVPGRARTFAALVPVALGIAVAAPVVLDANEKIRDHHPAGALGSLLPTIGLAALAVAAVVAIGSLLEGRVRKPETRRLAHRGFSAAGLLALVAVVVVALVVAGNPIHRIDDGWHSFKQGYSNEPGQPLTQGLGSGRYDYYTVSLDLFKDHPLRGVGADNFQQDYLAARRSDETPRYPHSVEMRTLAQTGLVGALLLIGFVLAALWGALTAIRRGSPLGRATAAAATMAFVYWLIHGSFDWFWEFAGLGAPAFAMLGLACGLGPGASTAPPDDPERQLLPRIAVVVALVLAALSMALPWLSDTATQYAADHWREDPTAAFNRLDHAASLDPLSADPYLVAGTIALKRSDQARAKADFRQALKRQSRSAYAVLELGALASVYGDEAAALRLLTRAAALNPRDRLTRKALADVKGGRRVQIDALNDSILGRAREVGRGG